MARCTPHPPLVFMICVRELFVRALADNHRPKGETLLSNAPYWNTDVHGRGCLGNMRVPDEVSASTIPSWEHAYFASELTHPIVAARLTTHAGGILVRWSALTGRRKVAAEMSPRLQADASWGCHSKRRQID